MILTAEPSKQNDFAQLLSFYSQGRIDWSSIKLFEEIYAKDEYIIAAYGTSHEEGLPSVFSIRPVRGVVNEHGQQMDDFSL